MLKERRGFRPRMMGADLVSWPGRAFGCLVLLFSASCLWMFSMEKIFLVFLSFA